MPQNLKQEDESVQAYNPQGEELDVQKHLISRIEVLKKSKQSILDGINFESIMREADREYQPRLLSSKLWQKSGGVYLLQDESTGLRGSRIQRANWKEGEEWRSDISEPSLLVKIQTALSILVDRNPEAIFKATKEKYKNTAGMAQALWRRSWSKGKSTNQLKLFIFDLAKYGWAIGRTYPRKESREGRILVSLNENPSKNKYKKKTIVEYNDVYREKLDPYRTWIDDMTNLTDPFSMDDWYFEKDYSKDSFKRIFEIYDNAKYVEKGQAYRTAETYNIENNKETVDRNDIITVGFYESKNKDLYSIFIPKQNIVLYFSPLPNDSKKLSCWWTYWIERNPRTPYGIGLYEIIKHDKVLYDRLMNMSLDQMIMAIYPMLFYSGAKQEDITISPGLIKQKLPGTTIEQVKVQYDQRGFEGLKFIQERIDENTGITPTLQGEVQGKTLGEVLHAKDAALKRLNIPLTNIAQAIEDEAYISLSWMSQIYSTPEVLEFVDENELNEYQEETGNRAVKVTTSQGSANRTKEGELTPNELSIDEQGISAEFFPVLDLSLTEDREGVLIESPEDRFFQVGVDILPDQLKWEGVITVKVQSMIAPSQEIDRQRKLELFNIIMPVIQLIIQFLQINPKGAVALLKPVRQILEIQDEKPENWLPDEVLEMEKNPQMMEQIMNPEQELMVDQEEPVEGGQGTQPLPSSKAQTVVPQNEVTNHLRASLGQIEKAR